MSLDKTVLQKAPGTTYPGMPVGNNPMASQLPFGGRSGGASPSPADLTAQPNGMGGTGAVAPNMDNTPGSQAPGAGGTTNGTIPGGGPMGPGPGNPARPQPGDAAGAGSPDASGGVGKLDGLFLEFTYGKAQQAKAGGNQSAADAFEQSAKAYAMGMQAMGQNPLQAVTGGAKPPGAPGAQPPVGLGTAGGGIGSVKPSPFQGSARPFGSMGPSPMSV